MGTSIAGIFWAALALYLVYSVFRAVVIVPQQHEYIVERLGKYKENLKPGLAFLIPFIDKVAFKQDMKEMAIEVPPQMCFTKDNVKVEVDGVLYVQVTDALQASYGITNHTFAAVQLAQTTTRSVVGTMDLDRTAEDREEINARVRSVLQDVRDVWGITVKRYEIKNVVPPNTVRDSMERQMAAERQRRALLEESEGRKQALINDSEGQMRELINLSEGERQRRVNEAEGKAAEIEALANATAESIRKMGSALSVHGGPEAMRLNMSQRYFDELKKIGQAGQKVIVPADIMNVDSLLASVGLGDDDLKSMETTRAPVPRKSKPMDMKAKSRAPLIQSDPESTAVFSVPTNED